MSIRHAANRFRKSSIAGWDGTQWIPSISRGALIMDNRGVGKTRTLLLDPIEPIPDNFKVIKIGDYVTPYLVAAVNISLIDSVYSQIVNLRLAPHLCTIDEFLPQTAASGMKINPLRNAIGTFFCDHQSTTNNTSKTVGTIRYSDDEVVLPSDTVITTSHEITLNGKYYEVEEVYEEIGLIHCRCIVKQIPQTTAPWGGSAQINVTGRGVLS